MAGHVDSVREPGSYILSEWTRQPYFVVRGKDGVLRAFLNTCRHRGAPLILREKDEPLRALVCPFHGWTYGLDGALRGIPESSAFPCIDKRDYGLKECSVAESTGFVWVHPTRHEPFDPAQELGAFAEDFAEFHLERFVSYQKGRDGEKGQLEASCSDEPGKLPRCAPAQRNLGSVFPRRFSFSRRGGSSSARYGRTEQTCRMQKTSREKQRKLLDFVVLFYLLFPNTIFMVREDNILITRFLPLAPDRTLWSQELLYLPDKYVGESGQKSVAQPTSSTRRSF